MSSFLVQNPRLIISHLSLLVKNKCLISARFGRDNDFYITTLPSINEENNTVVLDYGPKEILNQRILKALQIDFDTNFLGIKVSFTGTTLKKITHKGIPAFSMPIPKELFWVQRREYYRVKIPLSKPSYCQLMLKNKEPVNLQLYDISLSGFAMLNVSKAISDLLIPSTALEQCKLILLDAGESMISFEICAKYIINPDKVQKIQKIGCKLIKITRPVEEVIQRYMQQIQRENLLKE